MRHPTTVHARSPVSGSARESRIGAASGARETPTRRPRQDGRKDVRSRCSRRSVRGAGLRRAGRAGRRGTCRRRMAGGAGSSRTAAGNCLHRSADEPASRAATTAHRRRARGAACLTHLERRQQSCCCFALFPCLRCSSPRARVWCLRGPLGIFFAPQLPAVCHRLSHKSINRSRKRARVSCSSARR